MVINTHYKQLLPTNHSGRDFVVGDVHGCFSMLEQALTLIHFDPLKDRLLMVGDLIDRGGESAQLTHYLAQPWCYAVRGNHEQMLLEQSGEEYESWFNCLSQRQQQAILSTIEAMPLVIEVSNGRKQFAILHAQFPVQLDNWFSLASHWQDEMLVNELLWGRSRCRERSGYTDKVDGIDWIICGHTPIERAKVVGNHLFIDTRFYDVALARSDREVITLVNITDEVLCVIECESVAGDIRYGAVNRYEITT